MPMLPAKNFGAPCLAVLIGFGVLFSGSTSASAQFWQPGITARDVVDELRDEGFRHISPPILNRDVYVLDALDPYHVPVRVIVSAFDGRILAVHRQRGVATGRPLPPVDDLDDDADWRSTPRPPVQSPPKKQAAVPPVRSEPHRMNAPQLTPKTPAPVKSSPLAAPKEPAGEKNGDKKAPVSALPGTKTAPRVIPIAPAATPAPTAAEPKPAAPAIAPPAPLDDTVTMKRPETPMVAPAPLE